jgi:hypothetical protein
MFFGIKEGKLEKKEVGLSSGRNSLRKMAYS